MVWILSRLDRYDNDRPTVEIVFSTKEKAEAYVTSHPIADEWSIEGWIIN